MTADRYQQFYELWRESSGSEFDKTPPYELPLGVDKYGRPLLPFCFSDTLEGRILVTKSYEYIFQRILRRRRGTAGGVVLNGQPGTGESLSPDPYHVQRLNGTFALQEKLLS